MNNSHLVKVKYLGPTNTLGSRIQLITYDVNNFDNRLKPTKLTLSYDYASNSVQDQAEKIFKDNGLTIIGANGNQPLEDVFLLKWDIEKMRKLFKVKGVE